MILKQKKFEIFEMSPGSTFSARFKIFNFCNLLHCANVSVQPCSRVNQIRLAPLMTTNSSEKPSTMAGEKIDRKIPKIFLLIF